MEQGYTKIRMRTVQSKKTAWLDFAMYILLGGIVIAYSMLYFNNTYPISEGWGINYVELIFHGKVPYRDFYYYLPPLNLLVDAIFWKLSFGSLLMFRGWYLLQRVLIYILLYKLLKRFFNKYTAFIACAFTSIMATGEVYDLIGDYNQTMCLLTVLLMYCDVYFVRADTMQDKIRRLIIAGIVLGLIFLNKQTIFVACFLTHFIVLTAVCVVKKDKAYFRYCLSVAVGVLIPIGITSIILALNGALVPYIEQVYLNVEGKGSLLDIIVKSISSRVWQPTIFVFIALVASFLIIQKQDNKSVSGEEKNLLIILLLAIMVSFYGCMAFYEINTFVSMAFKYTSFSCAFGFCVIIYLLSLLLIKRKPQMRYLIKYVTTLLSFSIMVMVCLYSYMFFSKELYTNSMLFAMIQNQTCLLCFIGIIALMMVIVYKVIQNPQNKNMEMLLYISVCAFCVAYAEAMTCGTSAMPASSFRIALPLLLCFILPDRVRYQITYSIYRVCIIAVCIVLCMTVVSQKQQSAYSWWGTVEKPIEEKQYRSDLPALRGMTLSADQVEMYDSISKVIIGNTNEDAVIWGYPHIKLFNILTNRYNMDTFVPVLFYDVVSDEYVEKELELLKQHHPDVIVWENIPWCIETHENVFRNGTPLKQRDIEEYMNSIIPVEYTLVKQYGEVSVYIKNESILKGR